MLNIKIPIDSNWYIDFKSTVEYENIFLMYLDASMLLKQMTICSNIIYKNKQIFSLKC